MDADETRINPNTPDSQDQQRPREKREEMPGDRSGTGTADDRERVKRDSGKPIEPQREPEDEQDEDVNRVNG